MKKQIKIGIIIVSIIAIATTGIVIRNRNVDITYANARYLEDLDYLFDILRGNFPHFGPAYRLLGVDAEQLMAELSHTSKLIVWQTTLCF
ncbi:MAG: hypothetical protein FWC92_11200 [Defluviitaleaceae bacterium]|nr:hypothetical protein [Defluviitaleaceae bacterium]